MRDTRSIEDIHHFWERRHAECENLVDKCMELYEKMECAYEKELFDAKKGLTEIRLLVRVRANDMGNQMGKAYHQWKRAEKLERLIGSRNKRWAAKYWDYIKRGI